MFINLKIIKLFFVFSCIILISKLNAEEEEIYLKSISDQIQVITKDLKTLEKAVYQKSDISTSQNIKSIKSDGLNEDILTKHLLKLNDIEDQFRELTNKFEEVNFKLDKLSTRVTKIQSDTQLRFSDIESGSNEIKKNKKLFYLDLLNHKILVQHLDIKCLIYLKSKKLVLSKVPKQ